MICPACDGDRVLPVFAVTGEQIGEIPCPGCEGSGLDYCCGPHDCRDYGGVEERDAEPSRGSDTAATQPLKVTA